MMTSISEVRAAKEIVKRVLVGVSDVFGIGITWDENGEPTILINVAKGATASVKAKLSKQPIDVSVQFEEVSTITFENNTF